MKCYKHPKVNAVGVCSECGKGVCSKCSVEVSGKIYCKSCTDKVFGNKKEVKEESKVTVVQEVSKEAPKVDSVALKKTVLGQSSLAWTLGIIGFFIFPPVCWGLGTILGYMALSKASDNPNVFSKRDNIVCGIGAMANMVLLGWWGMSMINLL